MRNKKDMIAPTLFVLGAVAFNASVAVSLDNREKDGLPIPKFITTMSVCSAICYLVSAVATYWKDSPHKIVRMTPSATFLFGSLFLSAEGGYRLTQSPAQLAVILNTLACACFLSSSGFSVHKAIAENDAEPQQNSTDDTSSTRSDPGNYNVQTNRDEENTRPLTPTPYIKLPITISMLGSLLFILSPYFEHRNHPAQSSLITTILEMATGGVYLLGNAITLALFFFNSANNHETAPTTENASLVNNNNDANSADYQSIASPV